MIPTEPAPDPPPGGALRQRLRPPRLALALLALALVVHLLTVPRPVVGWPARVGLGAAVLLAGVLLMGRTARLLAERGTTHRIAERPTSLVASGPYRWSRNPMYIGVALALAGIGIVAGTWPFLLVPIAFLVVVDLAYVRWEERTLDAELGEPYRAYRERVRRWL